jgi:fluoride exporter
VSAEVRALSGVPWSTLAVISAGGVLGALARYGLTAAFPAPAGRFDWAVFAINVTGCFLIGIVVVLVTESRRAHHLIRPFLATGVLGGFTTFSTYIVGIQRGLIAGAPHTALIYAAATPVTALAAAWAGIRLAAMIVAAGRDSRDVIAAEPLTDDPAPDGPPVEDLAEQGTDA